MGISKPEKPIRGTRSHGAGMVAMPQKQDADDIRLLLHESFYIWVWTSDGLSFAVMNQDFDGKYSFRSMQVMH